jgi:hypothetical protein
MEFASIIKAIAPSNSVTLLAYKPCTTRAVAKVNKSATNAIPLFCPILYTPPIFPSDKRREECSRVLLSHQVKTTLKLDSAPFWEWLYLFRSLTQDARRVWDGDFNGSRSPAG